MPGEPTLLRVLLTERHWQKFETFEAQFRRAAHELAEEAGEPVVAVRGRCDEDRTGKAPRRAAVGQLRSHGRPRQVSRLPIRPGARRKPAAYAETGPHL